MIQKVPERLTSLAALARSVKCCPILATFGHQQIPEARDVETAVGAEFLDIQKDFARMDAERLDPHAHRETAYATRPPKAHRPQWRGLKQTVEILDMTDCAAKKGICRYPGRFGKVKLGPWRQDLSKVFQ